MEFGEVIFILVVFMSNIIQSVTGFAGTMLAMPASILLIGIENAKTALNGIGFLCCVFMIFQNYRNINKKEFFNITFWMLLGIIIGNYIFRKLPLAFLMYFYSGVIIIIAIKGLTARRKILIPEWMMRIILLCAGVIHAMFISGGALLVIYAVRRFEDKSEFRATLTGVWILLNGFLLFDHVRIQAFTPSVIWLTLMCIPFVLLGIFIGNWIHGRISQKIFRLLANVLLLISGIIILL